MILEPLEREPLPLGTPTRFGPIVGFQRRAAGFRYLVKITETAARFVDEGELARDTKGQGNGIAQ